MIEVVKHHLFGCFIVIGRLCMDTKPQPKAQKPVAGNFQIPSDLGFDFNLWSQAVRSQMMAALQKKES